MSVAPGLGRDVQFPVDLNLSLKSPARGMATLPQIALKRVGAPLAGAWLVLLEDAITLPQTC